MIAQFNTIDGSGSWVEGIVGGFNQHEALSIAAAGRTENSVVAGVARTRSQIPWQVNSTACCVVEIDPSQSSTASSMVVVCEAETNPVGVIETPPREGVDVSAFVSVPGPLTMDHE